MRKANKNEKGITLVALVVTIVVLLILAGISLSILLGKNGIITKATQGKANYETAQGEEQNTLNNTSDWIEQQLDNNGEASGLPKTQITKPYLPTGFTQVAGTTLDNGLTIQDSKSNQYVWVEVPMTTEVYKTAGLSITDFGDDNYTKIENDLHSYTNTYRNNTSFTDTCTTTEKSGLTSDEYDTCKKQMIKSIYQNGGFWVGKYEVGDSVSTASNVTRTKTSGTANEAVIKEGQHPYDYVTCSQAEEISKRFNPDTSKYNTNLMYGVQWDLILRYIESKGSSSDIVNLNCTTWGNYINANFDINKGRYNREDEPNYSLTDWIIVNDSFTKQNSKNILLTTGATERNSKQNIYDLAGNVWEWTIEYTEDSTDPFTLRGGSAYNDGGSYPASYRYNFYNENSFDYVGFRVALYTK